MLNIIEAMFHDFAEFSQHLSELLPVGLHKIQDDAQMSVIKQREYVMPSRSCLGGWGPGCEILISHVNYNTS